MPDAIPLRRHENGDFRNLAVLLGVRSERPNCSKTHECKELAPPHCCPPGSDSASYRFTLASTHKIAVKWERMSALGQKRTWPGLFKNLGGAGEDRMRYRDADPVSGIKIDHKRVLGRRLYRQIGWLLALEDAIDIASGASVVIEPVRSVRDQAASGYESTIRVHCRKLIPGRQCNYLVAVNEGRGASYHDESAIRLTRKCANATFDLAGVAQADWAQLHS